MNEFYDILKIYLLYKNSTTEKIVFIIFFIFLLFSLIPRMREILVAIEMESLIKKKYSYDYQEFKPELIQQCTPQPKH